MTDQDLNKARNQMFYVGLSLMVLGALALITPFIAGGMVVIMLGVLIVLAGISSLINSTNPKEKGFLVAFGVIKIVFGVVIISHPILGLTFLTLLLAIYFLVEGLISIIMAFQCRENSTWVALLITGIISLLLGILIYAQWPDSSLWVVGFFIGINLMFSGISLAFFSKDYLR